MLWLPSGTESLQNQTICLPCHELLVLTWLLTWPFDLSNFLWALKHNYSSTRVAPFDFNSQQDVAEILQVVFDAFKGVSLAASSLICNTQRTTESCNHWLCFSVSEENLDIMPLQVPTDKQTFINQFARPEILPSQSKWFCPSCKTFSETTRETYVMNSTPIFSNHDGQLVKNKTLVSSTQSQPGQHLTVPITIEGEISFMNKYSITATINHSVTLNRGHYWTCIKDLHSSCWNSSNDKLVSNVEESSPSNTTSYILFYRKV